MAFHQIDPLAQPPAPPRRGGDLAFAIRFFAWTAAFLGGIWALDHFFQ